MGAPPMNLLNGEAAQGRVTIAGGEVVPGAHVNGHAGALVVGIRPEDVLPDDAGALGFEVDIVEELGAQRLLHGRVGGQAFSVAVPKDRHASTGAMRLALKPGAVHLFDAQAGRRL
jgi:sn-glycerol 3-phosphate transport system ATP-binding protein